MIARITRYMHLLDQMTAQLSGGCDELAEWYGKIRDMLVSRQPPEEIAAAYAEWLANSTVQEGVAALAALVAEIKGDPDITDMAELQMDITNANEWALKLCMGMLANSKLLAGYK